MHQPPHRLLVGLITLVFFLRLASQLAITPLGEGLDYYNHFGYIVFLFEQGRPPVPTEPSISDWLIRVNQLLPAPDRAATGSTFSAWASLSAAEQAQMRAAINTSTTTTAYVSRNNQSQQPPLYYWLLTGLYQAFPSGLNVESRFYVLGLSSIILSALALPGLYKTFRLYFDANPSLLALLALAWYPNLLPFLARLTNDTLAFPLMVWGLYFCLRARASQRPAHLTAAGLLLLLACFTKAYAYTLLPVYLLCAVVGERGWTWRGLRVAGPLLLAGVGLLFAYNLALTGLLVPLSEIRQTATLSLATRLLAVLQVNPLWFVGGLVKGFWWLGYWSFVSPGAVYYLPLAALAFVLLPPRAGTGLARDWLSLSRLWPHFAALGLFLVAMLWHAALFMLTAEMAGRTVSSGNEGWYLNVLLGSVFVILGVLLERRQGAFALPRVLAVVVVFFVLWNGIALAVLGAFWGGGVLPDVSLRAVPLAAAFAALLKPATWANWQSLPGVMAPLALTAGLPLLLSLAGTALVLSRLRMPRWLAVPETALTPASLPCK